MTNTARAVVDHNSEYIVGQAVPEPSVALGTLAGLGLRAGGRRLRRKA